jgi:anaerobic selenocysteine-containing dehydrogenase
MTPDTETFHTTCPMDCPDACSLEVRVEGDRVVALGGGTDNPDTRGFICKKVGRFAERLDHADRLLRPLVRTGPKGSATFRPVSWEEAVEVVTDRFREIARRHGAEAILQYNYGGSNGKLSDGFTDALYFRRLGATSVARTLCAAVTGAVARDMYGSMPGVGYGHYPEAEMILVWGQNPKASSIHLVPYLKEARQRGAFVAVVDPVRNFSDREVDLQLAVLPGTDLPLALGMIHRLESRGLVDRDFLDRHAVRAEPLLEAAADWPPERSAREAGVALDDLLRLADTWGEAHPAVVRSGWGIERNSNGGPALAAVMALPALTAKFGLPGGGYTMSNSAATKIDVGGVLGLGEVPPAPRVVNMTRLPTILLDGLGGLEPAEVTGPTDPGIHGLFVYNANPVASVPDQNRLLEGLAREDLFTVVLDQVMTDTAPWADVVLPATTFLEHRDLKVGYGSYVVGGVRPAIAPRGEARSNHRVFSDLARAWGMDDPAFSWSDDEAAERVAETIEVYRGAERRAVTEAETSALAAGRMAVHAFPDGGLPVQMKTVHPGGDPNRKIDLCPACLGDDDPYRYLPPTDGPEGRFPLALVSPASRERITSTLGEYSRKELTLALHPDDADARGLASGDTVRVWNDLGEVICPLEVSDRLRPGVALLPKGAWRKHSRNGMTATALAPDRVQRTAGAAVYNDARVEVEPATEKVP